MVLSLFHFAKSYFIIKKIDYYYSWKKSIFTKTNNKIFKVNNKIKDFGCYKYYKFLVDKNIKDNHEKNMNILLCLW